MPLSTIDTNAALIIIDLQKGIVSMPAVHPGSEIVSRAAQLAKAFRRRSLPVVLVNVTAPAPGRADIIRPQFSVPADWSELVPELDQQPDDYIVSKQRPGAFIGTPLDSILRSRGVSQIFLAGISTTIGVESTARSAVDHGYNVVIVTDAITDRDADSHRHAVEKIFPRFAETDTTEQVLKLLGEG